MPPSMPSAHRFGHRSDAVPVARQLANCSSAASAASSTSRVASGSATHIRRSRGRYTSSTP
eukprot:351625-Chlamydomonas_euryale.AAC.3